MGIILPWKFESSPGHQHHCISTEKEYCDICENCHAHPQNSIGSLSPDASIGTLWCISPAKRGNVYGVWLAIHQSAHGHRLHDATSTSRQYHLWSTTPCESDCTGSSGSCSADTEYSVVSYLSGRSANQCSCHTCIRATDRQYHFSVSESIQIQGYIFVELYIRTRPLQILHILLQRLA